VTVGRADAEIWAWPDSLDALVAAPEFHSLLLENDDVRVLETRIGPGETVPVHTHRWPSVLYTLSTGHFVRRDGEGRSSQRYAGNRHAPRARHHHLDGGDASSQFRERR